MNQPITIYLFRDSFAPAGNSVVCVGEKERIEAALGFGKIKVLFHGEAVYTNDTTKKDYLGVWGTRNASRLRRLLREQGSKLIIQRTRPPNTRLRYYSTQPGERSRASK